MHDYITQLVENKPAFYSFSVLLLLIFLRLGWWLGSSFTRKKTKKQFKELEKEKNVFQRENKKMWDEEKKSLLEKNACIAVLFLFTNQLGFFMFEARVVSTFFAAFGNYFFWTIFLIARNLSYRFHNT